MQTKKQVVMFGGMYLDVPDRKLGSMVIGSWGGYIGVITYLLTFY